MLTTFDHHSSTVDTNLVGDGLHNGALCTLVEAIEFGHFILAQLKVVKICVALDPAGSVTLWQWDLYKGLAYT